MSPLGLPRGWVEVPLDEVADIVRGITFPASAKASEPAPGLVPCLRTSNVQTDLEWDDLIYVPAEYCRREDQILREGDTVMSMANSYELVGKVALASHVSSYSTFGGFLSVVRTRGIEPRFLFHLLRSSEKRLEIQRTASRTVNIANLSLRSLNRLSIRVPPLPEQRRIVAKIEELTAHSRRAREAFEAIPPLLENLRQSILAAAFSGRLTADWRAKHPDVEPATKLLERIRTERRQRWEEAELAKLRAKGKEPKDDTWKRRYQEPEPVDTTGLPELPEGWCWVSLDQLLSALRNGISTKPTGQAGIPILRISAVRPMAVDETDRRFLPLQHDVAGFELHEGDLLFTRYNGNPDLVGVCGVVPQLEERTVHPDKLIRGVPIAGLVLPAYLAAAVHDGASRLHIVQHSKTAAGQVGISGSDLKTTPVPLAPIEEQLEIARRLTYVADCEAGVERRLQFACMGVTRVDQSILAEAFRGELVSQEANDEPVLALLERIRTERETARPSPLNHRRSPRTPPTTNPPRVGAQHAAPAIASPQAFPPTVADVAIPSASPGQRSLFPGHEASEEQRGNALERVLSYLSTQSAPSSRAEILEATSTPPEQWPEISQALIDHPGVTRSGRKRGTRYSMTGKPTA